MPLARRAASLGLCGALVASCALQHAPTRHDASAERPDVAAHDGPLATDADANADAMSRDDEAGDAPGPDAPCPAPRMLCGAACVDVASDPLHCGGCGANCGAGRVCAGGTCDCPTGATACGGACVDTSSSHAHCGACDNPCPANATCMAGACNCPASLTLCSGACVDTATDGSNCGTCGNACGAMATCTDGRCVNSAECPPGSVVCGRACCPPAQSCLPGGGCGCGPAMTPCGLDCCGPLQHCMDGACR